jgi:uncharacterized protein (TIGR04255 family)
MTMSRTVFKHPPLVEIVAEVHWPIAGAPALPEPIQRAGIPQQAPPTIVQLHEVLFLNLASKASTQGFGVFERVIPPGFPPFMHQPVCRYRSNNAAEGSPLFQSGVGIFTANIVPPYKSWETFRPIIDTGLNLLDRSWPGDLAKTPFSIIRLRYIDAFRDNLVQGRTAFDFISNVLGFSVNLPASLLDKSIDKTRIKPTLIFQIPIEGGIIDLTASEGWINNSLAIILDTSVTFELGGAEPRDKAIDILDKAHDIIYSSFVGLTKKLHADMHPEN